MGWSSAGSPRFDPQEESPKFSTDIHQQKSQLDVVRMRRYIGNLAIPGTSDYAGQVKDPTHEVNV